jgi:hypothetical protein
MNSAIEGDNKDTRINDLDEIDDSEGDNHNSATVINDCKGDTSAAKVNDSNPDNTDI